MTAEALRARNAGLMAQALELRPVLRAVVELPHSQLAD
jgi:hypothetical protein